MPKWRAIELLLSTEQCQIMISYKKEGVGNIKTAGEGSIYKKAK